MWGNITHSISLLPPELSTLLFAMTPYGELRLSIPVAYFIYGLPLWQSYLISVIGNMIPPILIMLLAGPFNDFVQSRSGFLGKNWAITLNRARGKFQKKYQKWGLLGLVLFVAIPLPTTGAWTGALVAFLFGFPVKKSLLAIFAGVIIAGVVVSALAATTAIF